MKLYEFAPSGSGHQSNFYSSTVDFANNWEDHVKNWETDYTPSLVQEEARELLQVANAFLRGLKSGTRAFYGLDTLIRDELSKHWEEDGLDPHVIYDIQFPPSEKDKNSLSRKQSEEKISGNLQEWQRKLLSVYPNADIRQPFDHLIQAFDGDDYVGAYYPGGSYGEIITYK